MSKNLKTIIEPKNNYFNLNLSELYRYRELLWTFTYRDFRVRYAQTAIGIVWAVINPLFTALVLFFVFSIVARVKIETPDGQVVPHLLYTMAGMCGWQYFSTVVTHGGDSILGAQGMVKKIYFPRLMLPLSKALTALVEFAITLALLFVFMAFYRFAPSWNIVFFPIFLLAAIVSGLAGGIFISALTIRYRDFHHVTPMLMRLGMYVSPIAYPASSVPDKYLFIYYMNPMAGVIEGMRWSLIGGTPPHLYSYISFGVVLLLLIVGLFYFKKVEYSMADIL